MNDLRIIDADGHVQEKDAPWQDLLGGPYRKHAPRVVKDASGRAELLLEGKIWAKPSGIGCGIGMAPISRRPQSTTGIVRSGATAEGHGFGGHRHRSEFRHDRVLESAVSRKP